jgi:hypothetical protein
VVILRFLLKDILYINFPGPAGFTPAGVKTRNFPPGGIFNSQLTSGELLVNKTGQFNNLSSSGVFKVPKNESNFNTDVFELVSDPPTASQVFEVSVPGAGIYTLANNNPTLGGGGMQFVFAKTIAKNSVSDGYLNVRARYPINYPGVPGATQGALLTLGAQGRISVVINEFLEVTAIHFQL